MSAQGKWFLMMYSQQGNHIMPLVGDDEEVLLWETEAEARQAGDDHYFANALGFDVYEVGA